MRPPVRLLVLALLLVVAACATTVEPSDTTSVEPNDEPTTTIGHPASDMTTSTTVPEGGWSFDGAIADHVTMVALVTTEVPVYESPEATEPHRVVTSTTILGTTTVLTLIGEPIEGWAEVWVPGRPNGATGWIKTQGVHFYVVGSRIEIDLGERELVYYVDGEEVLRTTVAIGTARNPTPPGTYFVTDSVRVANPRGPWGPFALALSGRSDTITEFNGGDGIIGIHGTNQPHLMGQAVSLGCVRLTNDMMTLLHSMVPLGTPVIISA